MKNPIVKAMNFHSERLGQPLNRAMAQDDFSTDGLDVFFQRMEALRHESDDGSAGVRGDQNPRVEDEDWYDNVTAGDRGMERRVIARAQITSEPVQGNLHDRGLRYLPFRKPAPTISTLQIGDADSANNSAYTSSA